MILSILIPTFNYDCSRLVQQLQRQLPSESEIIVGDDCSTDSETIRKNSEAAALPCCHLYRSSQNIGRAAIRNALAREAKGDWLLFIDADAEVCSPSFIDDYLAATKFAPVVCGGTGNLPQCPRPAARLRYDYEIESEKHLTLELRRKFPYNQFRTFNFLIRRDLLLSIGFDESLKDYGHEDTLLGLDLRRRGIDIRHIDNKLINVDLEDADVFIDKTETALRTLARMELELQQIVRISALTLRLKHCHLLWFVRLMFKISKPVLRKNLLGKHPNQKLFAFYKLGYYSSLPI